MFDLSASAFVVDVPGPAPVLIFAPALLAAMADGAPRRKRVIELPPARSFFGKMGRLRLRLQRVQNGTSLSPVKRGRLSLEYAYGRGNIIQVGAICAGP